MDNSFSGLMMIGKCFFIFSVLPMAAFSVQDAQSQRFLPVENSPASPCSISMGGKGRGYTYYIGELPPVKMDCPARPPPAAPGPPRGGAGNEFHASNFFVDLGLLSCISFPRLTTEDQKGAS